MAAIACAFSPAASALATLLDTAALGATGMSTLDGAAPDPDADCAFADAATASVGFTAGSRCAAALSPPICTSSRLGAGATG